MCTRAPVLSAQLRFFCNEIARVLRGTACILPGVVAAVAFGGDAGEEAAFRGLLRQRQFAEIEARISRMDQELADPFDRYRISDAFFAMCDNAGDSYDAVEAWCKARPNSSVAHTVRGHLYTELAWRQRGGGYASTVSDASMRSFHSHLRTAAEALTKAYELNPGFPFAATEMITVAMGLGLPRDEMEKWFKRATSAKTLDPRAYGCKGLYLQPKWLGSVDELLAFVYETDRPDTPPIIVATLYGEAWLNMPDRRAVLLPNQEFLRRGAAAYARSLLKYPHRKNQRMWCAFFAARSGNSALAAEQFKVIKSREVDTHLHLWKSKAEFEADQAAAFRGTPLILTLPQAQNWIIGVAAVLFYMPLIVFSLVTGRSWMGSLGIGAVLVAMAVHTNGFVSPYGTAAFVAAHLLAAGYIVCGLVRNRRQRFC